MRDLIDIGMVCEYRVIASQTEIDEALLRIGSTGDFTPASIKAARKSEMIGDVVETYQRHVPGRQAIVFVVDVQDARDIADRFVAEGIRAASLDATSKDDRSEEHTSELQSPLVLSYAVFCLRSEERRGGKEGRW